MNKYDDDFEVCNSAWEMISAKYGNQSSATDYTDTERNIVLVWTVTGIVENGGFKYLFESELPGDCDLSFSIKAFGEIGCHEIEDLMKQVVDRVNSSGKSIGSKIERYLTIPDGECDDYDAMFWDNIENITKRLAIYVNKCNSC